MSYFPQAQYFFFTVAVKSCLWNRICWEGKTLALSNQPGCFLVYCRISTWLAGGTQESRQNKTKPKKYKDLQLQRTLPLVARLMWGPSRQDPLKLTEEHHVRGRTGVTLGVSHKYYFENVYFPSSLRSLVVFIAGGFSHTPDLIVAKPGMAAEPTGECAGPEDSLCAPGRRSRSSGRSWGRVHGSEEGRTVRESFVSRGQEGCITEESPSSHLSRYPPLWPDDTWGRIPNSSKIRVAGEHGLSVKMETNTTTSGPRELLHPKVVQHLGDLWLLLIQPRSCSKQGSWQLKQKFAFLNLLPCTSTVPQDLHNLESSKQIICYIIQSKRSEILALFFSPSSQLEKYKVKKPILFTNVNYSIVLWAPSQIFSFSFSFSYKVKVPLGS